jgi:hypothetical protein
VDQSPERTSVGGRSANADIMKPFSCEITLTLFCLQPLKRGYDLPCLRQNWKSWSGMRPRFSGWCSHLDMRSSKSSTVSSTGVRREDSLNFQNTMMREWSK